MTDWIIWYSNGMSFSSDDGPPENAPRDDVQIVVVPSDQVGKLLWHDSDYYCWQDNQWICHDKEGLRQYLNLPGKEKIRLCGFWIPDAQFYALYQVALHDPRMPSKTGQKPGEPDAPHRR